MKKIIFSLILMLFAVNAFAEKSYIVISCTGGTKDPEIRLSGNLPNNVSDQYDGGKITIGDLLNILAKDGFEVEQLTSYSYGSSGKNGVTQFVLSKTTSSNPSSATPNNQAESKEKTTE